jgi:hypothetical protein
MGPVLLEALRQPRVLVHRSHPSVVKCHYQCDPRNTIDVTRRHNEGLGQLVTMAERAAVGIEEGRGHPQLCLVALLRAARRVHQQLLLKGREP